MEMDGDGDVMVMFSCLRANPYAGGMQNFGRCMCSMFEYQTCPSPRSTQRKMKRARFSIAVESNPLSSVSIPMFYGWRGC